MLNNLPTHQPYSVVYLVCLAPDERLIMYRRLLLTDSVENRTGWTVTLRKHRTKEVDPRKTIKTLLFTAFSLSHEIIDRFKIELVLEYESPHVLSKDYPSLVELFVVKFNEKITLKLSQLAEIKAASEKEIVDMIDKKPYDFTAETREMLNMYFTLNQELEKEKTHGA